MKKYILKLTLPLVFISFLVSLSSCDTDDNLSASNLEIKSISLAANDSIVSTGFSNNMYIIRGTGFKTLQKIYFNERDTYFNPTLVTDNVIFVTIMDETPYKGDNNSLVLETKSSSITYDFPVGAPPPVITNFSPVAAGAGEIVTIEGTVFDNLIAVRFDDIDAEIVDYTDTQIRVRVPEGIVQSLIYVETLGGLTESTATFGFKSIIYDDNLAEGWWIGGWGGSQDFENEEEVKRGTLSIKRSYVDGYSGFQIGNGGTPIPVADFKALKVSIYGGAGAQNLNVVINSNYDNGKIITVTEGEWTDFTIPLSELGSPTDSINELVIQEYSGAAPCVIYIDDIGLI